MGYFFHFSSLYPDPYIELYITLRPSETLIFSGLPMMIWQKNCQFWSNQKNSWNQSTKKITSMIWQIFFAWALSWRRNAFKSIWRSNAWMDPLQNSSIISVSSLFCPGLVVFTVNDLLLLEYVWFWICHVPTNSKSCKF